MVIKKVLTIKYLIKNINDINDDIYEDTLNHINTFKRLKIKEYKSDFKKKKSILGEYLLNLLIEDYFNKEIIYNSNGKPFLKDNSIYFNISHSGEYVIACTSNKEIGVDIQVKKEVNNDLNKRINNNTNLDTVKVFNIKEAIIKTYGLELSNIKDIDIYDNNINITNLDNLIDDYYICIAEKK